MPKGQDDVDGIRPNAKRFISLEAPQAKKQASSVAGEIWEALSGSVPDAIGLHGPTAQVRGSLILIVLAIATGRVFGYVTAVFVPIFTLTLIIGVLRWSKASTFVRKHTPGIPDTAMTKNKYSRRRGGDR